MGFFFPSQIEAITKVSVYGVLSICWEVNYCVYRITAALWRRCYSLTSLFQVGKQNNKAESCS